MQPQSWPIYWAPAHVIGMTDKSYEPDSFANRTMSMWALIVLAAVAIAAYAHFIDR
jgi:hypothetical protein